MFWLLVGYLALQSAGVSVPEPDYSLPPVREAGVGTVYGLGGYHGTHTANGEPFEPHEEATCAHRTIELGRWIIVEHDGQRIWCRVTDRGPYVHLNPDGTREATVPSDAPGPGERWHGVVDLSVKAAEQVGAREDGIFEVTLRY